MKMEVRNLARVRAQVDRWMQRNRQEAEQTAKGLAATLANRLIENSPQWSGDFASNWRYSINKVDYTYDTGDVAPRPGPLPEPWKQFDRPAVQLGKVKIAGMAGDFKLGDTIYISNSSTHSRTYAGDIFSGKIKLRDVNMNITLKTVVAEFNAEFGRVLDERTARRLRNVRLGS